MALSPNSMQWISQQGGMLTYVDVEDGGRAVAYKLVPVTCWLNGQKFPHDVEKDIRAHSFKTTQIEGLDYYLVLDSTTNSVGQVAHYARSNTETIKPPEARAAESPPAVQKYLKSEKRTIKRIGG